LPFAEPLAPLICWTSKGDNRPGLAVPRHRKPRWGGTPDRQLSARTRRSISSCRV